MATLRIAACQLNLNVGDLSGNKEKILSAYAIAQDKGSDIAVFTELAVSGYPPEDLLLKRGFVHETFPGHELQRDWRSNGRKHQHCFGKDALCGD